MLTVSCRRQSPLDAQVPFGVWQKCREYRARDLFLFRSAADIIRAMLTMPLFIVLLRSSHRSVPGLINPSRFLNPGLAPGVSPCTGQVVSGVATAPVNVRRHLHSEFPM